MRYNEGFKKEIVKKMLSPGANIAQISRDIGLSSNTLYNWRNKFSDPDRIKLENSTPRNWKSMEKIKAVFEYGTLEWIKLLSVVFPPLGTW